MNMSFLPGTDADSPRGSRFLYRLDPRVKLVMTLLLMVGILITPPDAWVAIPLLWTLVGTLAALSQISALRLARLAGLALPFALVSVTLLITTPGHPILTTGIFTVTDAGLARFAGVIFKSWLSVQVALLLSLTTPFTELLWALESLRMPETLVAIVSFMYRYLFTLKDEAETLLRARAARSGIAAGTRSGGTLLWRARIAGGMVGSLFLRSYERSERVYAAMCARGYTGHTLHREVPPLTPAAVFTGTLPVMVVILIQMMVRLA